MHIGHLIPSCRATGTPNAVALCVTERRLKAEAELEASVKLSAAAAQIMSNPAALELRRMQMISEVGAENNSTTVLMIPSDFVSLTHTLNEYLRQHNVSPGA
ncbi:MAG TPA: hypothetical protein VK696_09745 [Steroidobacteraceae bacterium]|nr:hypothetical protein [Steroidobacteraceae bacterium]